MENRFENCQVLWGKRYRGKFTGIVRYAEAVVKVKDGQLYYVTAYYDWDSWDDADILVDVRKVKEFDKEKKLIKKERGFIQINSKEWKYLRNLLLGEV